MTNRQLKKNHSDSSKRLATPQIHRDRYRVFTEEVADGFYETDLKGNFKYFNNALCRLFGYERSEIADRNFRDFMDYQNAESAFKRFNQIYRTGQGITDIVWEIVRKDEQTRIIELSAKLILDDNNEKVGFRGIARDITDKYNAQLKILESERINQTLFRIGKALPHYHRIDGLLAFITREVQNLLEVESASVILLDNDKHEFYFFAVTHDDTKTGKRFKEVRFPANSGIAGEVYRTGKPIIVPDVYESPFFNQHVDEKVGFQTRSMLDVPIHIQDRMIGVLCAVNKKNGLFESGDVELLSAVASTVALPIENARINQALQNSYDEVKTLNRAKDQVIHHLSHELKTPVSVLSASLGLLARKLEDRQDPAIDRLLERSDRNLQRLLDMQYEIEDILRERDISTHRMLSFLLESCADEIEVLASEAAADDDRIVERIRARIDQIFGPRVAIPEEIDLSEFVSETLKTLHPHFDHRQLYIDTYIEQTETIWIPPEILKTITIGLIRNAIENTPDGSRIELIVRTGKTGPEFEVRDYGIGITAESQRLIFENYFSTTDTMQYSTGRPYDFGAGGRGFDLLRMKIFSERHGFTIGLISERCRFIPTDRDRCPGDVSRCALCDETQDCLQSGGTTVTVQFPPAEEAMI